MASLRKLPRCKNWIACFTTADGIRKQRSTGESNRTKAQKIADQYEEAARRQKTAKQVQRVMASLYKDITGTELPHSTVEAYFNGWVARKKPEVSKTTALFYEGKAEKFLTWLGERAKTVISGITSADIVAFRNAEAERVKAKTANHTLKFLRMVFGSARNDAYIVDNPCDGVGALKQGDTSQRRAFTLPELRAVLGSAEDEWKSMILFGLYTGQRLKDVALLTWENIHLHEDEIRLKTSKTGRQMILPIAPPLRIHIESLSAQDDPKQPVHPKAFQVVQKQGKTGTLSRQFGELLATAGLAPKKKHRKKETEPGGGDSAGAHRERAALSFHALRHTATSLLKNAGISAAVVQEIIGHDSEEMSRVYTHIETETMRSALAALPNINLQNADA